MGAFLNVKINATGFNDKAYVADIIKKGSELEKRTIELETEILKIVNACAIGRLLNKIILN